VKRKSDFSRKYSLYRSVPYYEPDPSVGMLIVKAIKLERPKVECLYRSRTLIVTQRISKEIDKNKKEIIRALYQEAESLFSAYGFLVNIRLEYYE
jgi:hypothetical protein